MLRLDGSFTSSIGCPVCLSHSVDGVVPPDGSPTTTDVYANERHEHTAGRADFCTEYSELLENDRYSQDIFTSGLQGFHSEGLDSSDTLTKNLQYNERSKCYFVDRSSTYYKWFCYVGSVLKVNISNDAPPGSDP